MKFYQRKRTPGHLGGSKPLLKKRRIHNETSTKKSEKRLQPIEEPTADDPVVEVVRKENFDEEKEANPIQELLSFFSVGSSDKKKSESSDKVLKSRKITKKTKVSSKSLDQDLAEGISAGEDDKLYENESDDDYIAPHSFKSIEDTFASHIDRYVEEYAGKYDSLVSVSREVKIPSLMKCVFEYKVPDNDVEKTLNLRKSLAEFDLKQSLIDNLPKTLLSRRDLNDDSISSLNQFQFDVLSILHDYKDFLFCERNSENSEKIRIIYCIHALNHVLKTRSRVIHHNAKLSKAKDNSTDFRDQGLTRPKVLIIVPFRESASRIVECLIDLVTGDRDDEKDEKVNIMNLKRFRLEFQTNESTNKTTKPQDFSEIFAGNTDDSFRVGLSVTKKSLKLYSDFYSSDIIIASPLGLRLIIGAEGEHERDFDFLSSIEVLIMDQADVYLMQNWEHVLDIMKHLHIQPKDSHGLDFSRVRMWALDGWYKFYRQTIVFSSVNSLQISSLFKNKCFNYEGRVIVRNPIPPSLNLLRHVYVKVPQTFYRFDSHSCIDSPDNRMKYFVEKIVSRCQDIGEAHTMIFIPSYFDFVKLRNYFRQEDINFTQICEYTKPGKVAQSRTWFFHGGRNFLLYTERCHFYNRFRIKGIRHLVFFQLPTYPHFYSELCNLMHSANQGKKFKGDETSMNCTVIYDKFDYLQLEAVVGTERAAYMIGSENDEHIFMSQASN